MFPAVRDSESSLTCQIELGQIGVGSVGSCMFIHSCLKFDGALL